LPERYGQNRRSEALSTAFFCFQLISWNLPRQIPYNAPSGLPAHGGKYFKANAFGFEEETSAEPFR
jgi:hypothetical protein